jgi:hypothetical protein
MSFDRLRAYLLLHRSMDSPMRRSSLPTTTPNALDISTLALPSSFTPGTRHFACAQCEYPLECVEQSRRSGSWLGSLICPNCRSEYLYAYRWGRLMRRS